MNPTKIEGVRYVYYMHNFPCGPRGLSHKYVLIQTQT
jgi:hypothetical protein